MDSDQDRQQEREHRRSHKHKRSSRRMEEDLNRSSFRKSGDSEGRPPPDKIPRTSGAGSCDLPKGDKPFYQREASSQPLSGHESGQAAIPVVVSKKSKQGPPQGDSAAVASVPCSGHSGGGSYAGERGDGPEGLEHGADYGGRLTTLPNSSLVNDDEAASRVEYRYQKVRGHASRAATYEGPYGSPVPSGRRSPLHPSFDSRDGESQSLQAFGRIEDVLARMERHLAASATAQATPSASTSTPPSSGEFSFIHIHFELLIFCL
jgi:hypothetical protein